MKPLFRYPGGKSRLAKRIAAAIFDGCNGMSEYFEPFFGSGAVCLEVLEYMEGQTILINDKDRNVMGIWKLVLEDPYRLIDRIDGFKPDVGYLNMFRQMLHNEEGDWVDRAMMQIVLHQTSYGGLALMGGAYSGNSQKIADRWHPTVLTKKILQAHKLFSRFDVRCTSLDFAEVLQGVTKNSVLYCDPPYMSKTLAHPNEIKGNRLYRCGFSRADHERLAETLKTLPCKWVLSLDDCAEARELYKWAKITQIPASYTLSHNCTVELLIQPKIPIR